MTLHELGQPLTGCPCSESFDKCRSPFLARQTCSLGLASRVSVTVTPKRPRKPAQCLKATNVSLTAAIDKYYASLRYTAELTEADLRFCYVSKAVKQDEDCVRRLYTSDQTYRELLRNDVLTGLQDIESEAGFLSRCKQLLRPGAAGKADGIDCTMIDEAEIKTLLEEALRNFDKLFESINAAEVKRAVEAL